MIVRPLAAGGKKKKKKRYTKPRVSTLVLWYLLGRPPARHTAPSGTCGFFHYDLGIPADLFVPDATSDTIPKFWKNAFPATQMAVDIQYCSYCAVNKEYSVTYSDYVQCRGNPSSGRSELV